MEIHTGKLILKGGTKTIEEEEEEDFT